MATEHNEDGLPDAEPLTETMRLPETSESVNDNDRITPSMSQDQSGQRAGGAGEAEGPGGESMGSNGGVNDGLVFVGRRVERKVVGQSVILERALTIDGYRKMLTAADAWSLSVRFSFCRGRAAIHQNLASSQETPRASHCQSPWPNRVVIVGFGAKGDDIFTIGQWLAHQHHSKTAAWYNLTVLLPARPLAILTLTLIYSLIA